MNSLQIEACNITGELSTVKVLEEKTDTLKERDMNAELVQSSEANQRETCITTDGGKIMVKKRPWWEKRWRRKYCAITLGRLRPGVNRHGASHCIVLRCGHSFYRNAFNEWIINCEGEHVTCPCCRIYIPLIDFIW